MFQSSSHGKAIHDQAFMSPTLFCVICLFMHCILLHYFFQLPMVFPNTGYVHTFLPILGFPPILTYPLISLNRSFPCVLPFLSLSLTRCFVSFYLCVCLLPPVESKPWKRGTVFALPFVIPPVLWIMLSTGQAVNRSLLSEWTDKWLGVLLKTLLFILIRKVILKRVRSGLV